LASGAISPAHPTGDGLAGLLAGGSNRGWLLGLLLVLATVLAYQPAWQGGFLWDDDFYLTQNRMLFEPGGLKQIWFSLDTPLYYPLVFTSFRLERALWGLHPTGYHWVNLLLHAASAVWIWRGLRRLKVPGAWLAGAVFALHPVNVESVAWISERKNTLAMFFYLLSLLWYLRFDPGPRPSTLDPRLSKSPQPATLNRQPVCYWFSLVAFVLALLSKTAVSPLPLVLLGLAWWRRGRVTGRDVWRSAPFFTASLVLGLVTVWFERHRNAFEIVRDDSFWSRLAGAGWAVWFYLYKAVLPLNLTTIYPRWRIDAAKVWSYVPGLLVVGAFLLCWRYRRSWGKPWLVCMGYYVVMLLPVLGFVNIGFMRYSLVADHWQYFAMIAPITLASAGVAMAMGRIQSPKCEVQSPKSPSPRLSPHGMGGRRSLFGATVCGTMLVGLGVLTWRQSALYANAEPLWQATLAANPGCWLVHYNLGVALVQKGSVEQAIVHFQEALRIKPDSAEAHIDLGSALLQKGRVDEAILHLQEALQIKPDSAEAHNNLGIALVQKGGVDKGIAEYQKALEIKSHYAEAHNNLGIALVQKGGVDEGIAEYQKALQIESDYAEAHNNLGAALVRKGRMAEAITQYQKALAIEPADPKTQNNLALLLATGGEASLRNGDKAVQLARQANELADGKNPLFLRTLAAAFAEAGRFGDAVQSAQRAIGLAQAAGQQDLAARLNDELKRYEAGLPLHQ